MRLYVDTNIFLDYLLGRKDKFRDLGLVAFEFFRRIIGEEYEVIISNLLMKELEFNMEKSEINKVLNWLNKGNKIIKVKIEEKDRKRANSISKKHKLHYSDCLHSVLAKKAKADFIITRNVKDFPYLVEVVLPESL